MLKYMTSRGADCRARTGLGHTILHLAAAEGRLDAVRYCVETLDMDVNARNNAEGKMGVE